jgi:hypothetical protein
MNNILKNDEKKIIDDSMENFMNDLDKNINKCEFKLEIKTNNEYFNDYDHNVLIYGKENYFSNQSIFKLIRENFRIGLGGLWFVSENEFLNVSAMIKNDAEYYNYKERVFTAFEVEDDFLSNAINLSHIYIIISDNPNKYLENNNVKEDVNFADFMPIIISSKIFRSLLSSSIIKKYNKNKIQFFIYADYIYNEDLENLEGVEFNNFLFLSKNINKNKTILDEKQEELILEEIKKMKPLESFFINSNGIKKLQF